MGWWLPPAHAKQHAKPLTKVNVLEVGPDVALVKLADAKRLGTWILFFNDHDQGAPRKAVGGGRGYLAAQF